MHSFESSIDDWIQNFLSKPSKTFNNLPPCPYAKKAWLDNKVDIAIRNPEHGYVRELHKHVKNINFNKINWL